jgi:hypothetical protein
LSAHSFGGITPFQICQCAHFLSFKNSITTNLHSCFEKFAINILHTENQQIAIALTVFTHRFFQEDLFLLAGWKIILLSLPTQNAGN